MRLISDGVVDREGVDGLAHRVGYTPRHLTRLLTAELGAGPLALARARRAQTARVLVETTDLGFADVAFAAGFSSIRQFNDTVREVYAASPTELRGGRRATPAQGSVTMRLAVRTPFAGQALLDAVLGEEPAQLWVAEANPRAIRFYERNGFRADGATLTDPAVEDLREIRMVR